jgi:hypothetical protein
VLFPERPPRNLQTRAAKREPARDDEHRDLHDHAQAESEGRDRQGSGAHEPRHRDRPRRHRGELADQPQRRPRDVAHAVHTAVGPRLELRDACPIGRDQRLDRHRILREIELDAPIGIH